MLSAIIRYSASKRYGKNAMNHASVPPFPHSMIALLAVLLATGPAQADLEFAESTADVGEVRAGAPLSHRFTFVNRGPEVVEITEIESSCGCLTPRLHQRVFQPGDHGSISLEVNTLSPAPGPHTWQVKVSCRIATDDQPSATPHSRLPTHPCEIPLRLTARVVREIVVEPAAITMFADGPLETEVRLTDLRTRAMQLRQLHTTAPGLQAKFAGEERDGAGHLVRKVQLTIAGDLPEGRHEEVLSLFTNDPSYSEIKIPITVVKRSKQRLRSIPSRVELTLRPGADLPARMILVRDQQNQAVEVETVTADSPAVTCHWAKGPGTMATLRVQVDPHQIHDPYWKSMVCVQVIKPIRQTLLIPVTITSP
jgi:hypothetical protein